MAPDATAVRKLCPISFGEVSATALNLWTRSRRRGVSSAADVRLRRNRLAQHMFDLADLGEARKLMNRVWGFTGRGCLGDSRLRDRPLYLRVIHWRHLTY